VTSLKNNCLIDALKKPLKFFFYFYPFIFLIALLFERLYPIYGILTIFVGIFSVVLLAETLLFGFFGIKVTNFQRIIYYMHPSFPRKLLISLSFSWQQFRCWWYLHVPPLLSLNKQPSRKEFPPIPPFFFFFFFFPLFFFSSFFFPFPFSLFLLFLLFYWQHRKVYSS